MATEDDEMLENINVLPTPRIDRLIRKAFLGKRVSAGTSVYATAALEHVFAEIVRAAEGKRSHMKRGPKAIDRRILVAAIRTDPSLSRLFRGYTFAPEKAIKIKKEVLLTKADKSAAMEKREANKSKKAELAAVPAVDED